MPFKEVPTKVDFPALELELLKFWKENGSFEKLRQIHKDDPPWSFIDGPITANNPMGVHHGWGRSYKDLIERFWAMRGHQLRYQNGFDCQGLWVEVEVEKEMGFQTKKTSRILAWNCLCASVKRACCVTPPCRRNSPSAWATGWTGTTRINCAGWPTV